MSENLNKNTCSLSDQELYLNISKVLDGILAPKTEDIVIRELFKLERESMSDRQEFNYKGSCLSISQEVHFDSKIDDLMKTIKAMEARIDSMEDKISIVTSDKKTFEIEAPTFPIIDNFMEDIIDSMKEREDSMKAIMAMKEMVDSTKAIMAMKEREDSMKAIMKAMEDSIEEELSEISYYIKDAFNQMHEVDFTGSEYTTEDFAS